MLVILCLLFIGVLSQREGHWKSVKPKGVKCVLCKSKMCSVYSKLGKRNLKKKKCNKYLRDNILQVIAIYKVTK